LFFGSTNMVLSAPGSSQSTESQEHASKWKKQTRAQATVCRSSHIRHQTGMGQSATCMTGHSVALRQKMLAIESDLYRDVSSNVNPREDVFAPAPFTAFPSIPDYMSAL
jgi:hypothetical protein